MAKKYLNIGQTPVTRGFLFVGVVVDLDLP